MHNLYTTLSGDTPLGPQNEFLAKILDEYLLAIERGEPVSPEDLVARHPDLADELRGYLSGLKKIHQAVAPAADGQAGLSSSFTGPAMSGELGDFRFVRELGRGGMGVVYEAEQISLGRRVALKVLPFSATVDEKQIARFKNEAQAAAQVNHPHIVPVFAIGQHHGVHFFAMQLIGGHSLSELLNQWRDTAESRAPAKSSASTWSQTGQMLDRLKTISTIGIQAAEAVHAAHEIGVVHRDIKPSNLLVDEKGKLWVTDFGVARCKTNSNLTETGSVVGTLRYMSPEQAQGQAALVDHRTDVYSLGVTLYELAALRHPLEDVPDVALAIESSRSNYRPPRHWNRSIPPDFENIVLKAMASARDERYATARELAEDLKRFQNGRPILARRPSVASRLGKWAARHRGSLVAATGVLALVVAGLAISLLIVAAQRAQKDQALQIATVRFRQAREMLDRFGARVNQGLASEVPGAEAVRKQLLAEMLPYYRQFASESAGDPALQADLATTFTKIGDLSEQLGSLADAAEAYSSARAIFERLSAAKSAPLEHRKNLALCCNNLAQVLQKRGEMDAARSQLHQALKIQQQLVAARPGDADYRSDDCRSDLATTYSNLGLLLSQSGDRQSAADHFRIAISIHQALLNSAPEDESNLKALAASYNNLSALFIDSEPQTARKWLDQALALQLRLVRDHPQKRDYQSDLALTYNNLGTTFARLARWTESERCLVDAATIQSRLMAVAPLVTVYRRDLSISYNNLGMTQSGAGDLFAAEKSFNKALTIQQQLVAAHPIDAGLVSGLGGIYNNLGMVHQRRRSWSDACVAFEHAIKYQRQALEQARDFAHYRESLSKHYYNYAQLLLTLDRPADAAAAILARRALWPGDPERLLRVAQDLAAACKQMPPGVSRDRNLAEVRAALEAARHTGLKVMPDLTASPFDVLATGSSGAVTTVLQASSTQPGSDAVQ
jgi:tetratricopeptide (TPR) repeat protein/tRNA A-37 threonylcarbamoyl transferase component Bud32